MPASAPRVRYPRLAAVVSASGITLVAVLGGIGLLPDAAGPAAERPAPGAGGPVPPERPSATGAPPSVRPSEQALPAPDRVSAGLAGTRADSRAGPARAVAAAATRSGRPPAGSGRGRRVVFAQEAQRVWLVGADGRVRRSYPVSGSREDNLAPGRYRVYSRSRRAWGIDEGGTMRYMVRFAHGERAAIGFHDIPVKEGRRVQSRAELGTPRSAGCIRQARPDAKALWRFAPVGTRVVVVG